MRERGWGVMWGCGGDSAVQPHSMGGFKGERGGTHIGTRTGTYTQMLHLPFSDLPLKTRLNYPPGTKPIHAGNNSWGINFVQIHARSVFAPARILNERQITHLICARLKYDLYDFLRGCFGAFYTRKRTGSRPKTPLKKSYRSYFRRAQIRWVIWRSSKYRKLFFRNHFPHISQIVERIHFGAYTWFSCIRTLANTGKYSWRIIYVLVSCQGVFSSWPRGSAGVQRYGCILRTAANHLGEIPQKLGAPDPLFWRVFLGGNTLGLVPASLPHALGYACTFYAPTSPPPK